MNRRNFLGWLGATSGTVAIYKQVEIPPLLEETPERLIDYHAKESPASCYVIRNQGDVPMVVNYKREGEFDNRASRHALHISTLLLPGEELTITAVPAKV